MSKIFELNEKEINTVSGGCSDPICVATKYGLYAAVAYGVAITAYAALLELDDAANTYLVEHPILNLGVQTIRYVATMSGRIASWILGR